VCLNVKSGANSVQVIFVYCLGSCFKSELFLTESVGSLGSLFSVLPSGFFQQYMVAHAIVKKKKKNILQRVLVGRVAWLLRKVGLEKVAEAGARNAWNLLF
jgi:tetrahydromethanopterin S-methyltransferase subunit C